MRKLLIALVAALLGLSGVTGADSVEAKVFDDVPATSYFADAALWAGTRDISIGNAAGDFAPTDNLTRAQGVTMMWRAFGSPDPAGTTQAFVDVPAGSFYEDAVQWARDEGIATGTTSRTFAPGDPMTRAQFSAMLWRAYGSETGAAASSFTDVPDGAYYEDAVDWMAANGIAKGITATEFGPNIVLNRAMGVTFLWRSFGEPGTFTLNVFHVNDTHSHLGATDIGLAIGGSEVEFELGGMSRVVSAIDAFRASHAGEYNVAVNAGDPTTGTLFFTLTQGEADAAMMNEVCFDIFTPGNHEFDQGDAGLAQFLDFLWAGECATEAISANIVPAIGTPLAPTSVDDYLEPNTVLSFGGENVGFVGLTIAQKTRVSSQPLDSTQFLDEIATAQSQIDLLEAAGVDKIVLVTHYTYDGDLDLASKVSGVDAIIGGDSHTLLGDFAGYGLSPSGPYPTEVTNADGDPVCIAHAWQYAYAVGELGIHWDDDGTVVDCTGNAHLLLGDVLDDGGLSSAAIASAVAADPQLMQIAPDAGAESVLSGYAAEVDVLAQEVIGTVTDDLCLARFPYDGGRSAICDDGDLPHGGYIQQLVTDAFLARAFRADIALQNSGGVRIDIPAGDITIADAYELLPFANTLYELEMMGAEVVLALEQGLGNVLDAGGSTGAYPYGSGIRWDVDVSKPFGQRFSDIEVMPKGAGAWEPIDPNATYIVVANSFMAGGGDGFAVLADVVADGRGVDTYLDYAQSFIDFVVEDSNGVIGLPTEWSTKTYSPAP